MALVSFGVLKCFLPWDQLGFLASKIITAALELAGGLFLLFGTSFLNLFCSKFSVSNVLCTDYIVFIPLHFSSLASGILPVHFLMFCKEGISNFL